MDEPTGVCAACQEKMPMTTMLDHVRVLHPDLLEGQANPLERHIVTERDREPWGLACTRCDRSLEVGDATTDIVLKAGTNEPGLAGAAIMETVCLECGIKELTANGGEASDG